MEYIKQLLSNNNVLVYSVATIVILCVIVAIWLFIRHKDLTNQNVNGNPINANVDMGNVQTNNMSQVSAQNGDVAGLKKDPSVNAFMTSEELLNNAFVISAEENAAKRSILKIKI